jgi:hypothetical protein
MRTAGLGLALTGLFLVALGTVPRAQEAERASIGVEPLVSIMELMQQTITPATNQLWSAYREPSTPAEWRAMEDAAVTLLAASSLTAIGGTGPMDEAWAAEPAWQGFNRAMIAAGRAALEASRNRDQEALLAAGDMLLPPCEGCHQAFNPAVINPE